MRLVSWNVNGLRAVHARNDLLWAFEGECDVVCLQETKIQEDALTPSIRAPGGWRSWWSFGKKKGYSGTAVFAREGLGVEPFNLRLGDDGHPEYDEEGRVVALDFGAFLLFNVYFPNGASGPDRFAYKLEFHERFMKKMVELAKERSIVITGDFNIAHKAIDLAMPERWGRFSGFHPEERAWMDRFFAAGFVDTFRAEKGDLPRQYTFWETRVDARKENLGWRIDYFVVSQDLEEKIVDAWISPQIMGSDHCPIGLELDVQLAAPAVAEEEWGDLEEEEDEEGSWRRR